MTRQGNIRFESRDYAGALKSFDSALEEVPDHLGALMGRGLALAEFGREEEAIASFDCLIEVLGEPARDGALAAALANRGIIHDRAGRHAQALKDDRAALARDTEVVA
ncbi:MAG: tetratricopeptide repeat protein [Gammaproteobacteria bacterium]|nr:tetratricopeptide repeat protein [Gammaproteobacteria bacterium]